MAGYVVAGILVAILAVATLMALVLGLLGVFGQLRFGRCAACGHVTMSPGGTDEPSCAYCRHPHVVHPIGSWRHRAPVGH